MGCSRRHFVMIGLGVLAAGCESGSRMHSDLPMMWPQGAPGRPRPTASGIAIGPPSDPATNPQPSAEPSPTMAPGGIAAVPRSRWAAAGAVMGRINPMNGVSRITVHHEGWNPVWFDDSARTAERLELLRRSHMERLGAGDIGYHYIIDRAGRVWQGRDVRYQGAHVKAENEHNVGVMVLGNFDVQQPSDAQLGTLRQTIIKLRSQYGVPLGRVYTHRELNPTECPGRSLQPRMVALRHNGALG